VVTKAKPDDGHKPDQPGSGSGPRPTLVLRKARLIMDAFSTDRPELTLAELRQLTDLPATTCARLVANLVDGGMLDRSGDLYRIGTSVLRWAAAAVKGIDLVRTLTPVLEDLRDAAGESAGLYIRREMQRTCVAVVPTRHQVIWQLQVGLTTPLHVGSGGRALLAFDPEAIERVFALDRERFTDHTLVNPDALRRSLQRTRQTGVATSQEELAEDVAGVSAPVFGADNAPVASLGVAGPAQRFTAQEVDAYIPEVLAAARRASALLGGRFAPDLDDPQPARRSRHVRPSRLGA